MKTCTECQHHEIIPDPDPEDWFCNDDVAVVCKLKTQSASASSYASDRQNFKTITVSCRPYFIEWETIVPDWCPLKTGKVK